MLYSLLTLYALVLVAAAQIAPGVYRIGSVDFAQLLVTQSGDSIAGFGGTADGNLKQTWFVAPTSPPGKVTIQNVGTLEYIAVSGTPANGSTVVPSTAPFEWTLQSRGIAVDGFYITAFVGPANSLVLTQGPPELLNQQWTIGAVTPFPSAYRLWNTDTNTYLTAGSVFPSPLSATPINGTNAAQVWTLAGTGPGSTLGTLASFKTSAYIAISDGTLGTFSTSQILDFRWLFGVSGGSVRLASFSAPSPNVISIGDDGTVFLDAAGAGSEQAWTFVPVDTSLVF